MSKSELEALNKEIARCKKCILHKSRVKSVPGVGPADADIMFIGEAPGFHENQQGIPFVGAAGRFLDELLAKINLQRQNVFIANVVKCRPPGNRDPEPEEIAACRPYLDRQIKVIKPKMVITLGRFSMARYFPNANISQIHGQPRKMEGVIYYPMYHPAAALHQPSLRRTVEKDVLKIPGLLARIDELIESERPEQAEQLSLF
ncbi:MAG: uracil-DNA glycosylase [Anaerolineaceae bacterium 4572_32.1]|nr:MAG: uracil-DNA glycosylase [Anaerolineaceae bacterium 4572_32.1]